ncbi:MAG: S1 RNA-binding domain-containing protein, partial [Bacilli bacterium]
GMVHVSQLSNERVDKAGDVVNLGDEIMVKCLGLDKRGRLNLSRKDALPVETKK